MHKNLHTATEISKYLLSKVLILTSRDLSILNIYRYLMTLSWLYTFKTTNTKKDTNTKCHQLNWCIPFSTRIKPVACAKHVCVQSQGSTWEDWVRMTEIWSLELSDINFNWLSEFNKKIEGGNKFLSHWCHFLMSIFLPNKSQFFLASLFSVTFCEIISQNTSNSAVHNILYNSSFHYINQFSSRSLSRHPLYIC